MKQVYARFSLIQYIQILKFDNKENQIAYSVGQYIQLLMNHDCSNEWRHELLA